MAESLQHHVARVLRDRRKLLGLSQQQVADRAGTYRPLVARVEAGRHEITLSTIEAYARALNWTAAAVVSEAEHARAHAESDAAGAAGGDM